MKYFLLFIAATIPITNSTPLPVPDHQEDNFGTAGDFQGMNGKAFISNIGEPYSEGIDKVLKI